MPVLTNFLSVQELSEQEVALSEKYASQLREYRKAVECVATTFNLNIECDTGFGFQVYEKEKEALKKVFETKGFLPEEFADKSWFGRGLYSRSGNILGINSFLAELSWYPTVSVAQLKMLANALSFVIIPVNYINMNTVFKMYYEMDSQQSHWAQNYWTRNTYASKIQMAYSEFQQKTNRCIAEGLIQPQTFYMLCPISYYDAWLEVSSEEVLYKYFSTPLYTIATTLGLIIPTQRNLYRMASTNTENIRELKETMDENFRRLKESIEECHRRISWVEEMVYRLEANMQSQLKQMELKIAHLENLVYCLLDPIIFSLDSNIDISKASSNNARARIGLCFGPEMPVDFFVEKGLTSIFDKRLDKVTYIFHPKYVKLEESNNDSMNN